MVPPCRGLEATLCCAREPVAADRTDPHQDLGSGVATSQTTRSPRSSGPCHREIRSPPPPYAGARGDKFFLTFGVGGLVRQGGSHAARASSFRICSRKASRWVLMYGTQ